MDRELLIMPGAPLLAPELSGRDGAAAAVRDAVAETLRGMLDRAADAGAGLPLIVRRPDDRFATARTGSLAAWGADVTVGAGNHLPELIARRMLQLAGADEPMVAESPAVALLPDPWDHDGPIIAVADGPAALTSRAPLTELPGAADIDDACAAICGGAEGDPLAAFPAASLERVGLWCAGVWQDLAAFAQELADAPAAIFDPVHRDATHGVGYHVARWSWT